MNPEPQPLSIDTATGKEAPPELSTERVKSIFSSIARRYDLFNLVSSFGACRRWVRMMAALAPISHESRMLDIAAGTGDVTFTMAALKRPASILCTDLVPEMLAIAEERYEHGASQGVPVEFEIVDAQAMPFADQSFDVVTVAYGIRNMPERMQALREAYRVLKPGGSLVCLEFSTPPNPIWRGLYHFYLKHMIPFWGGLITGDKSGFVYLGQSIEAFPDQEEFAAMLQEAGFDRVSWTNCTGGIAAIHVATR